VILEVEEEISDIKEDEIRTNESIDSTPNKFSPKL
jgi:hypothetical protein